VVLASKLPVSKSPRRNLTALARGGLLRWDIVGAFGSEELSALSPAIAELAMKPVVELNPDDAAERNLKDGDTVDLTAEFGVAAPVKLNADLARGTAGIPLVLTNTAVVPEEVKA
jgi:NADH-quinone oxidoreductase subunit G